MNTHEIRQDIVSAKSKATDLGLTDIANELELIGQRLLSLDTGVTDWGILSQSE